MPDWYSPQYLNRYSYVRNNPLRYTDPTGHAETDNNGGRRILPYCNFSGDCPIIIVPAASTGGNQRPGGSSQPSGTPPPPGSTGAGTPAPRPAPTPPAGPTPSLPPPPLDGTVAVGACLDASAGVEGIACLNAAVIDEEGNVLLLAPEGGIGGSTGINLSWVGFVQFTDAANVNEVMGNFVNVGGAAGEGPVGGIDLNLGNGSKGQINGITIFAGGGLKINLPLPPASGHVNVTNTWSSLPFVPPIRLKLW